MAVALGVFWLLCLADSLLTIRAVRGGMVEVGPIRHLIGRRPAPWAVLLSKLGGAALGTLIVLQMGSTGVYGAVVLALTATYPVYHNSRKLWG